MNLPEVKAVLGADIKGFQRGMAKAQDELKDFAHSAAGPIGALGKIGAAAGPAGLAISAAMGVGVGAILGLGAAILSTTKQLATMASDLTDLSAKTGVSTDALQKLGFAGSLVGVSMQEIGQAAGFMQRNLASGDSVFQRLGLSLGNLKKLKPEEQFAAIGAEIIKLPSAAQQTAAAMEVFGRAGATLLPLFKGNMAAAAEEAQRLGIILGESDVAAADNLDDSLTKLNAAWIGLQNNFASAISQGGDFGGLVDSLAGGIGTLSKALQENGPLIQALVANVQTLFSIFQDNINFFAGSDIGKGILKKLGLDPETMSAMRAAIKMRNEMDRGKKLEDEMLANIGLAGGPKKAGFVTDAQLKADAAARKVFIDNIKESFKELQKETEITDEAFRQMGESAGKAFQKIEDGLISATREAGLIGAAPMPGLGPEAGIGTSTFDASDAIARGIKNDEILRKQREKLDGIKDATAANKTASIDWSAALADVKNSFDVLGISADSVLGRILGGVTAGMAGFERLTKLTKGIGLGGAMKTTEGKLAVGGAVGSMLAAGSSMAGGPRSAGGRALAGAAMGAQIGAIAGPWGMAAGAVVGAIIGAFHKPSWVKVGADAGKVLGFQISKELSEAIEKTAKKLKVSNQLATLLNIGSAIKESGRDPREFAKQIGDLMNATKMGAVPTKEGIASIGEAFTQVADAALKAGTIGDAALVMMIKRSRELSLNVPEIKEFVSSQLSVAAEGVSAIIEGLKPTTQSMAESQGVLFAATFFATLKEKGLVEAAKVFGPILESLQKQLEDAGLKMPAGMEDIVGLIGLGKNEKVAGASAAATGVGQVLTGMGNAGFMTNDILKASTEIATGALAQAKAGGATDKQGLELIAPLLSQLVNATLASGGKISPELQALLDQAKEQGVTILEEPINTTNRLLGDIKGILQGGALGESSGNVSTSPPDGAPGSANGPPSFAGGSGGIQNFGSGTMAMLHGEEGVFTKDEFSRMTQPISVTYGDMIVQGSNLSKEELSYAIQDALKANSGGLVEQMSRSLAGRR